MILRPVRSQSICYTFSNKNSVGRPAETFDSHWFNLDIHLSFSSKHPGPRQDISTMQCPLDQVLREGMTCQSEMTSNQDDPPIQRFYFLLCIPPRDPGEIEILPEQHNTTPLVAQQLSFFWGPAVWPKILVSNYQDHLIRHSFPLCGRSKYHIWIKPRETLSPCAREW